MTEKQNLSKFRDFCGDLKGVTLQGIVEACDAWRRSENVHFPKPGQMLALCRDDIRRRAEEERGIDRLEALLDGGAPLALEDLPGRKLRSVGDILAEYEGKRRGDGKDS